MGVRGISAELFETLILTPNLRCGCRKSFGGPGYAVLIQSLMLQILY